MKPFKHSTAVPSDKWDYLQRFCPTPSKINLKAFVDALAEKVSLSDRLITSWFKIVMHLIIVFSCFIQDSLHKTDYGVIRLNIERNLHQNDCPQCWEEYLNKYFLWITGIAKIMLTSGQHPGLNQDIFFIRFFIRIKTRKQAETKPTYHSLLLSHEKWSLLQKRTIRKFSNKKVSPWFSRIFLVFPYISL